MQLMGACDAVAPTEAAEALELCASKESQLLVDGVDELMKKLELRKLSPPTNCETRDHLKDNHAHARGERECVDNKHAKSCQQS